MKTIDSDIMQLEISRTTSRTANATILRDTGGPEKIQRILQYNSECGFYDLKNVKFIFVTEWSDRLNDVWCGQCIQYRVSRSGIIFEWKNY